MSLQRQENAAKQRRKTHWSALINGSHKEALTVFHRWFFLFKHFVLINPLIARK